MGKKHSPKIEVLTQEQRNKIARVQAKCKVDINMITLDAFKGYGKKLGKIAIVTVAAAVVVLTIQTGTHFISGIPSIAFVPEKVVQNFYSDEKITQSIDGNIITMPNETVADSFKYMGDYTVKITDPSDGEIATYSFENLTQDQMKNLLSDPITFQTALELAKYETTSVERISKKDYVPTVAVIYTPHKKLEIAGDRDETTLEENQSRERIYEVSGAIFIVPTAVFGFADFFAARRKKKERKQRLRAEIQHVKLYDKYLRPGVYFGNEPRL